MTENNHLPNTDSDDIYKHIMSSSDDHAEDKFIAKEKNKKKRNVAIASILSLAILGGVGSAFYYANPFKDDKQQVGKANPGAAQSDNGNNGGNNISVTKNQAKFWQVDGKTNYPINLDNWQILSHNDLNKSSMQQLINKYSNTSLAISSHRLPSESSGFTSDKSKIKLPDGTMNPMYTTITSEDYQRIVETDVERLINPMFGDWQQYEYPNGHASQTFQTSKFADVFTTNWLEKNKNKNPSTYFPIYADWQENNYNMGNKLLGDNNPRWMGTVNSMNSQFTYNDKTQQYTSDVTVNVKFSAWAQDQSTLTKTGTLKLKVITNTADTNKQKLLIDDAKLTMDKE